jgi:signal transduction histidine kinase
MQLDTHRLWLGVPRLRAACEGGLLALVLSGVSILIPERLAAQGLTPLLLAPIVLGYFALRAQGGAVHWLRRFLRDLGWAMLLLLPLCVLTVVLLSLIGVFSANNYTYTDLFVTFVSFSIINILIFIIFRGFVYLMAMVNRLRRRHLLWALTHAHATMVLLTAGILILLLDLLSYTFIGNIFLIISFTVSMTVLSVIALLLVIPPTAFVSYLVIRRATRRLSLLTTATHSLREGHYSVRIPVEGEDEVAQLQANFNVMAADLERALQELKQERDTVAGLLKAHRELVAAVSHELRTPVATVRGYLETALYRLQRGEMPASLPSDLEVMAMEVLHLQRLVEDLFALARAEVGRLTLRCVPTDVGALASRIVKARAPLAWQSGRVQVVAKVPSAGPLALVDPERLSQALHNLLHNGIRHTPPGGIVVVIVSEQGQEVILQVRDTGEGIAPEELPLIWNRFYQASSKLRRDGSGSGLGLALVKEWVEAMQGRVAVESVLQEGSCFSLFLPRACQELSSTIKLSCHHQEAC